MTKADVQLKQDIEQELSWDSKVNAAQIGYRERDRSLSNAREGKGRSGLAATSVD
jgi:hypothetical protein